MPTGTRKLKSLETIRPATTRRVLLNHHAGDYRLAVLAECDGLRDEHRACAGIRVNHNGGETENHPQNCGKLIDWREPVFGCV